MPSRKKKVTKVVRRCACGARITNLNPKATKCVICYANAREDRRVFIERDIDAELRSHHTPRYFEEGGEMRPQ